MTAFTPNLFQQLAIYYDLVHSKRNYDNEVDFLDKLFKNYHNGTSKALELFCGTGGHTIPMCRIGHEVTGLDSSLKMLEIAKQKSFAEGLNINYELGDCRSLGYAHNFDLVYGFGQSIHYLLTYDDINNTFKSINRVLKLGGLLVFDMINAWRLLEDYQTEHYDIDDDGTRIIRIERTALEKTKRFKRNNTIWIIKNPNGSMNVEKTVEEYKILFEDELEYLLRINGFEMLTVCYDYQWDRVLSEESVVVILVARKIVDIS